METILNNDKIYVQLLQLLKLKKPCALATVTATQGSTPQKPGSSAIFGKKGLIAGTIGGGAVEHAVADLARKSIRNGKTGYYKFNLNNDITEPDAAICGGGMSVYIDGTPQKYFEVFDAINNSDERRIPGIIVTICNSEKNKCSNTERFWLTSENVKNFQAEISDEVIAAAKDMFSNPGISDFKEIALHGSGKSEEKLVFLEAVIPLPQLIIAGAGHVGKALSHLGNLLGFEVIVWDDRVEFANKTNLPDAHKILTGSLGESLGSFTAKSGLYVVIVTRGHKNDAEVLRKFIGSDVSYIGMIGSRRKIAQLRESFIGNGWTTNEGWNKIHTPIGLDIGSKTVQEIAVSIAAQLIQVRSQIKYQ